MPRNCDALHLEAALPVLRLSRVTYDEHDRPLEYVQSLYRGDRYQLRAISRGAGDGSR